MKFEWKLKSGAGEDAIGYQRVYETLADDTPVLALLYCFPKFKEFGDGKLVLATVFFRCDKNQKKESFFSEILSDIGNLVNSTLNKTDRMLTQLFYCKELPDIEYLNHGDFFIGDIS